MNICTLTGSAINVSLPVLLALDLIPMTVLLALMADIFIRTIIHVYRVALTDIMETQPLENA